MNAVDLNEFVTRLREAARGADAPQRIRAIMNQAFEDPAAVASAMPEYKDEDEILFEDDTVSIWHCRFDPNEIVPPHDHQTTATIGVYEGAEDNAFYLRENGKLVRKSTKRLGPGDVTSIGPDGIHSVQAANGEYSYAVHVYLAKLTTIERSLFDWESGDSSPFTDENYDRLKRVVS